METCLICRKDCEDLPGKLAGRRCRSCGAVWFGRDASEKLFGEYMADAQWTEAELACPAGHGPMADGCVSGIQVFRCAQCHGVLLKRESARAAAESLGGAEGLLGAALFMMSLPERLGRSVVGSAGGFVKVLAGALVPGRMKKSQMYHIAVQKMLRFLVEDVGGVEGVYQAGDGGKQDRFVLRKAVGNAIEFAGMATLHISPVFVLAILSDAAKGTRSYLNELVVELKRLEVIQEGEAINNLDQLMGAIEKTSGNVADNMDTPPVSVDELKTFVKSVRSQAEDIDITKAFPVEMIDALWDDMAQVAKEEDKSIFSISSAVTMALVKKTRQIGFGVYGSLQAGYNLVDSAVFDYYREGFKTIRKKGYWQVVSDAYKPYTRAVQKTFNPKRRTMTERVLSFRWLGGLWRWFKRLLGFKPRSKGPEEAPRDPQA